MFPLMVFPSILAPGQRLRRCRIFYPAANFVVDFYRQIMYIIKVVAAVAQSVERLIGSEEVTGPIPVSSLRKTDVIKGLIKPVRSQRLFLAGFFFFDLGSALAEALKYVIDNGIIDLSHVLGGII